MRSSKYCRLVPLAGGLRIVPSFANEQLRVEIHESAAGLSATVIKLHISSHMQVAATEQSWSTAFKGAGADALFNYICLKYMQQDIYARYLAIIQSSGMGKSRLVDELGKQHFVVPICLRMKGTKGTTHEFL